MSVGRLQVETSPIYCIFFSEFDHAKGPKITYQVPDDYITKELFYCYKSYIIPKAELRGKLVSVNASNVSKKIIGFPMFIDDAKYYRNQLIFNLCFVCDSSLRTLQYEPIVEKLANDLVNLELADEFLSKPESKCRLPDIMKQIMDGLNTFGHCSILANDTNTIHLKVIRIYPTPLEVEEHDVPIFTENQVTILPSEWDLTTQQILPFIDGFKHIAKIASDADVEMNLVKACIKNMIYYEAVTLIPILMYSNVYIPTLKLYPFSQNRQLRDECIKYVSLQDSKLPSLRTIYMLYCNMTPETTLKHLCIKFNPRGLGIDEKKLVQFGLIYGIIRRVCKYPAQANVNDMQTLPRHITKYFTGDCNYDEICCKTGLTNRELDEKIEKEPSVFLC